MRRRIKINTDILDNNIISIQKINKTNLGRPKSISEMNDIMENKNVNIKQLTNL